MPMTEHHASRSSRRRRICVTTWDGVRQAKTCPSTGSQLGFSGIWSNTGIWFHDRQCEHLQLENVQSVALVAGHDTPLTGDRGATRGTESRGPLKYTGMSIPAPISGAHSSNPSPET